MTEKLRPRLDRLQELSKHLNTKADQLATVVQGVEAYLNEVCRLGLYASVIFQFERDEDGIEQTTKYLCYARYGPKFRLVIFEEIERYDGLREEKSTLWANSTRDEKLNSYKKLPELLDDLIQKVETTLGEVDADTETIESLIPVKGKKKEATS